MVEHDKALDMIGPLQQVTHLKTKVSVNSKVQNNLFFFYILSQEKRSSYSQNIIFTSTNSI